MTKMPTHINTQLTTLNATSENFTIYFLSKHSRYYNLGHSFKDQVIFDLETQNK